MSLPKATTIDLNSSIATFSSSIISRASISGAGKSAASSCESSLSQMMSRFALSRAISSS